METDTIPLPLPGPRHSRSCAHWIPNLSRRSTPNECKRAENQNARRSPSPEGNAPGECQKDHARSDHQGSHTLVSGSDRTAPLPIPDRRSEHAMIQDIVVETRAALREEKGGEQQEWRGGNARKKDAHDAESKGENP